MESYPIDAIFSPTIQDEISVIEFSPRLSLQRYVTVFQVIKDFNERRKIRTVTEFGCGSFVFFDRYLVKCEFLSLINQIDIDRERLQAALHMIETNQFFKRSEHPDREPLKVNIFQGNVARKDSRVLPSDVVVAIEVIEHLYEKDLSAFPSTVFEFLNPQLVVVTTPNYDFNTLFNDGGKLRDEDHKFEFTKSQFIDWAVDIVSKYPHYHVKFYGIGALPQECSPEIGLCTQMAIFERDEYHTTENDSNAQEYNLIGSYTYFTNSDTRTEDEKIMDCIDQRIIKFTIDDEQLLYIVNEKCTWNHRYTCLPLSLLTETCDITEESLILLMSKLQHRYPLKYLEEYGYLLITNDECEINNCDDY